MRRAEISDRLREVIRLIDSGRPSHARYEVGQILNGLNKIKPRQSVNESSNAVGGRE